MFVQELKDRLEYSLCVHLSLSLYVCLCVCTFISVCVYVQESKDRLAYLIDVFLFTESDIQLNCEALTWSKRINPVFDDNDVVSVIFARRPLTEYCHNFYICAFCIA